MFSKNELITIANGLDALIRVEGKGIADNGIVALSQTLGQVNLRVTSAISAFAKVQELIAAADQQTVAVPEDAPPLAPETADTTE